MCKQKCAAVDEPSYWVQQWFWHFEWTLRTLQLPHVRIFLLLTTAAYTKGSAHMHKRKFVTACSNKRNAQAPRKANLTGLFFMGIFSNRKQKDYLNEN